VREKSGEIRNLGAAGWTVANMLFHACSARIVQDAKLILTEFQRPRTARSIQELLKRALLAGELERAHPAPVADGNVFDYGWAGFLVYIGQELTVTWCNRSYAIHGISLSPITSAFVILNAATTDIPVKLFTCTATKICAEPHFAAGVP
jgi:hypothetical protein